MPLQDPTPYLAALPDPTEQIRKNLELSMQMNQERRQAQLQNAQIQEHQQKVAANEISQQRLAGFQRDMASSPASPEGMLNLYKLYPEKFKELDEQRKAYTEVDQKAQLRQADEIGNAMLNKDPAVVKERVEFFAKAYENSKRPEDAQRLRSFWDTYQKNPDAAIKSVESYRLGALGPEKYAENAKILGTLPGELAIQAENLAQERNTTKFAERTSLGVIHQAEGAAFSSMASGAAALQKAAQDKILFPNKLAQEAADTRTKEAGATTAEAGAEVASEKQGLELRKLKQEILKGQAETKKIEKDVNDLPSEVYKGVSTAVEGAKKSQVAAKMASDLAAKIEKTKQGLGSSGWLRRGIDVVNSAIGNEGAYAELDQQYTRVMNSEVLDQLRGLGKMTDNEYNKLREGYPARAANPDLQVNALRRMAEVAAADVKIRNITADWLKQNRDPGSANRDFTVAGRIVRKGDDLVYLLKAVVPDIGEPVKSGGDLAAKHARRAELQRRAAQ